MATLEDFIRTGHLGPIILGMTPPSVISALGEPQNTSRKLNPLHLKYGCVQLTFWKSSRQRTHQLREIALIYQPVFEPLPPALAFTDWSPAVPPTKWQFQSFLNRIGYLPTQSTVGASESKLVFLSGVTVTFTGELLESIRLLQRETKEPPPLPLTDEREPSVDAILDMLEEAARAQQVGAYRAALLISWAALEATLRRAALSAGNLGRIGVQPSILIRELFSSGQITSAEHRMLEELRQLRAALAHGLDLEDFDVGNINKIDSLTKRLLTKSS